jgi:hypothetical protein
VGAVVVASLALAVAACGDDDDEEATDTTPTTVPPRTPGAPSSSDAETSEEAPTEHICPHVTNFLLVRNPQGAVLDLRPNVDQIPLDPNDLPEILGWDPPPDSDAGAMLSTMFAANAITAYRVTDGTDALEVASDVEIDNSGVADLVAAPPLLLTLTGHWGLSPADDPQPATGVGNAPSESLNNPATVAVVDTGYSDVGEGFDWLDVRVDPVDVSFDAEPTQPALPVRVAGHGRFVSSVIVQEAPNVAVRVARLDAIDLAVVPINLAPPVFTTDELQLYIAVQRLLNLGLPYSALNLSLGAYACENLGKPVIDNSGLAIKAAIDLWTNSAWEGSVPPIVAAAGNHVAGDTSPLPPFLPAAYDTGPNDSIYSVMSIDDAGNTSAFSNPADIGALGERLIGVGPDVPAWTYWSGSSFATALLTARTVLDGSIAQGTQVTSPDHVQTEPTTTTPITAPPNTTASTTTTTAGNADTTTTKPPAGATTTTIG